MVRSFAVGMGGGNQDPTCAGLLPAERLEPAPKSDLCRIVAVRNDSAVRLVALIAVLLAVYVVALRGMRSRELKELSAVVRHRLLPRR